jgi:hypothetical protein
MNVNKKTTLQLDYHTFSTPQRGMTEALATKAAEAAFVYILDHICCLAGLLETTACANPSPINLTRGRYKIASEACWGRYVQTARKLV